MAGHIWVGNFFSEQREMKMTRNDSWAALDRKSLNRRALQFSRKASPFDSYSRDSSFREAEETDSLLGDNARDIDDAVAQCRRDIDGKAATVGDCVSRLMDEFGKRLSLADARILAAAIRRSLEGGHPISEMLLKVRQDTDTLKCSDDEQDPVGDAFKTAAHAGISAGLNQAFGDAAGEAAGDALGAAFFSRSANRLSRQERERLTRDSQRIRYARQFHRAMPAALDYTPNEIRLGSKIASARRISFEQAVSLLREAK
jgi:hypothetical protein